VGPEGRGWFRRRYSGILPELILVLIFDLLAIVGSEDFSGVVPFLAPSALLWVVSSVLHQVTIQVTSGPGRAVT